MTCVNSVDTLASHTKADWQDLRAAIYRSPAIEEWDVEGQAVDSVDSPIGFHRKAACRVKVQRVRWTSHGLPL